MRSEVDGSIRANEIEGGEVFPYSSFGSSSLSAEGVDELELEAVTVTGRDNQYFVQVAMTNHAQPIATIAGNLKKNGNQTHERMKIVL